MAARHHAALPIRHRHHRRLGRRAYRGRGASLHRADNSVSYDVYGPGNGRRQRGGGLHQPVARRGAGGPGAALRGAGGARLHRHRRDHRGRRLLLARPHPADHPDAREHPPHRRHVPHRHHLGAARPVRPDHRRGGVPGRQTGAHPALRDDHGLPPERLRGFGLRPRLVGLPPLRRGGARLLHTGFSHHRGRAHAPPAGAAQAVRAGELPGVALDQEGRSLPAQSGGPGLRHFLPVADGLHGPLRHHRLASLRQGERAGGPDHRPACGIHPFSARRGLQHDGLRTGGARARRGQPARGQTHAPRHTRHRLRGDEPRRGGHLAVAHGAGRAHRPRSRRTDRNGQLSFIQYPCRAVHRRQRRAGGRAQPRSTRWFPSARPSGWCACPSRGFSAMSSGRTPRGSISPPSFRRWSCPSPCSGSRCAAAGPASP